MFAIIWRGFGIIVPIIFLIIGFIICFFFDGMNTKFSNPNYLKWTAGISSLPILLLGLGTLFDFEKKELANKTGFKRFWFYCKQPWNHHFMFVPIFVWGLILIITSICLFLK
ncbi:MAG: hypothetical protein WCP57_07835 [Bacteroidota bacterium]